MNINSKPFLKNSLYSAKIDDDTIVFLFGKLENVFYKIENSFQKELLLLLDGERTIKEIHKILNKKNITCSIEQVIEAIIKLYDLFLIDFKEIDKNEKMSRQKIFWANLKKEGFNYSEQCQNIIENSKITLLGLGGFGSHILYNLVFCGFQKVKCVDFDIVEKSNLNRQILYKEKDIGNLKTEAAKKNISEINSNINYEFINQKITSKNDIKSLIQGSDMAILAADTPRQVITDWINEAGYETNVPILFTMGFTSKFIRIGPLFIPGKTLCYNCCLPDINLDFNDKIVKFINNRYTHGTLNPYLSVNTGILVVELLKHFTNYLPCKIYNAKIEFDIEKYECNIQSFKPKENCHICKNIKI